MEMLDISLRLPAPMVAALQRVATEQDVSVGQVIRAALHRDLARRQPAKPPNRADERLVAPLRALLADDFAFARDWADLLARLRAKGYVLAEAGGGLVLLAAGTGQRMCKGSELGYPYALLMRRFQAPFPGHSHRWAFERVRRETSGPAYR
jgi:hypothetical protein